jgi:LysM repeat protein/lysophospholipase L1-like esterase
LPLLQKIHSVSYSTFPSFLDTSSNYIEWFQRKSMDNFYKKLSKSQHEKVTILHIGDSHIQTDISSGTARKELQKIFGYGGRGIVFPYSIGNTHATYDYFTKNDGNWEFSKNTQKNPKLPISFSGITGSSRDTNASFSIHFRKNHQTIHPGFKKIKLFCSITDSSLECKLVNHNLLSPNINNSFTYEWTIPDTLNTLKFQLNKSNPLQKQFEIYGISVENTEPKGLLYHSVGINGATMQSFLSQKLFEEQAKYLDIDLVIFDLSTNDLARGEFNRKSVEHKLNLSIDKIRRAAPNSSIIIVGMQDSYLNNSNIENACHYSNFIKEYCKNKDIAFYDYFSIAGGRYSMKKWNEIGLAQSDLIHLTPKGYKLKGELLTNALLNSYLKYNSIQPEKLIVERLTPLQTKISSSDSLIFTQKSPQLNKDNSKFEFDLPFDIEEQKNNKTTVELIEIPITIEKIYFVRKGDTLGKIAKLNNTSISAIKLKNSLTSDALSIDQKLLIP